MKVGHTYYNADGDQVKIIAQHGEKFLGDDDYVYDKDGNGNGLPLVREKLSLEVGKTYINGEGDQTKIVRIWAGQFVDEEGCRYNSDGSYIHSFEPLFNLVREA